MFFDGGRIGIGEVETEGVGNLFDLTQVARAKLRIDIFGGVVARKNHHPFRGLRQFFGTVGLQIRRTLDRYIHHIGSRARAIHFTIDGIGRNIVAAGIGLFPTILQHFRNSIGSGPESGEAIFPIHIGGGGGFARIELTVLVIVEINRPTF